MAVKLIRPTTEVGIENAAEWLAQTRGPKRVLDVGGAAKPLRHATHVLDLQEYIHRHPLEGRGELPERFTEETWLVYDINETPWPFDDDYFDYVWCSQVVEDIRDPIAVCREMQRVAKEGFISTVSRQYESAVVQEDGVVGYHHHRWLIEARPLVNEVVFTFKSPILHVDPELRPLLDHANHLLHFEWMRPFDVREAIYPEGHLQRKELEQYLRERRWE